MASTRPQGSRRAAGAMPIGIGDYQVAAVWLGLTLIIQVLRRRVAEWIDHRSEHSGQHSALFGRRESDPNKRSERSEIL